jgi:hypothetical protein
MILLSQIPNRPIATPTPALSSVAEQCQAITDTMSGGDRIDGLLNNLYVTSDEVTTSKVRSLQ